MLGYRGDTPPNSSIDSIASPKMETTKEERVRVCSLARNTLGVERHVGAPRWGLG